MENSFLKWLGIIGAIGLVVIAYGVMSKPQVSPGEENNQQTNMKKIVVLHTTEGDIEIELSSETPVTSSNFANLAGKNFYDNTIFHRVLKGFMIQGGDPNTAKPESETNIYGTGGPGYKFNDEKFTGEYTRGTVAMANSGPNTNGSQFFIMHATYPLPKNYIIFGRVIKGMEVVDKIANAPVTSNGNPYMPEDSKPVNPVIIKSVQVTEK